VEYEGPLRILWISNGRVVMEDEEGFRVDVLLKEIAADERMIARLNPNDAFRLGVEAAAIAATRR